MSLGGDTLLAVAGLVLGGINVALIVKLIVNDLHEIRADLREIRTALWSVLRREGS